MTNEIEEQSESFTIHNRLGVERRRFRDDMFGIFWVKINIFIEILFTWYIAVIANVRVGNVRVGKRKRNVTNNSAAAALPLLDFDTS